MGINECDDGNFVDGDGCSSDCKIENGWTCTGGNTNIKDCCTDVSPPVATIIRSKNNSVISIRFSESVKFMSANARNLTEKFLNCIGLTVNKNGKNEYFPWVLTETPSFTSFKEIKIFASINFTTYGNEVRTSLETSIFNV